MSDKNEQEFLSRVRNELDTSTRDLDELTVARLRAARLGALDHAARRKNWFLAGGVGAATVAAAIMAVVVITPAINPAAGHLDQIEMLADADLDVYDNLEFYRWLAEQRRAG